MNIENPTTDEVIVFGQDDQRTPDLRLIHYNDVYHVDPSSAEPAGGVARFMTVCRQYNEDAKFKGQSKLLTFFSGDAFNPSLESSVTKGAHAQIPWTWEGGTLT
jgi:5'-nucleotidase